MVKYNIGDSIVHLGGFIDPRQCGQKQFFKERQEAEAGEDCHPG